MAEIIAVTSDLRVEVVDDDPDAPHIYIYSLGMHEDGEVGVVVWPREICLLIDALATAAGLLAQGVARLRYCECCGGPLPKGAKPQHLDAGTSFWLCGRCAAAVRAGWQTWPDTGPTGAGVSDG